MNNFQREYLIKSHSPLEWYNIFSDPNFDEMYFYESNDLGVTYTKERTIFKVWAPTANKVELLLYEDGNYKNNNILSKHDLSYNDKGVWTIDLKGDYINKYYTYRVEANGSINETNDPYAKACGINGKRGMIVDFQKNNPKDWDKDKHIFYPINQSIIYELHVGDFSNDKNSGIKEEYRGKFMAFTQEETFLNGNETDKPTCLNYLKKLGITSIHFLPIYDFGSVEEDIANLNEESKELNYNWGYDPINYNCLEGSYSTNPFDGNVRIKEFKQMVQCLHKNNISIIMDVVYNHTYTFNYSSFNFTVPFYYYRQKSNGKRSNGSFCGNDTASERKMFHKYIINSILFWINEYHIDGFRFDLMGSIDLDLMNDIRETLNKTYDFGEQIIIYGEPWVSKTFLSKKSTNEILLADKNNINYFKEGISIFHDELRDSIKGSTFNKIEKGYINSNEKTEEKNEEFKKYFFGGIRINSGLREDIKPERFINYIACHDNLTLWDKLVISESELVENPREKNINENIDVEDMIEPSDPIIPDKYKYRYNNINIFKERNDYLIKINKLGAAMVMFSFGVPFLLAGEEGGRTKLGESNSYNSPKEINKIDWERIYNFKDLMIYYKNLINLRKKINNFYDLNKMKYFILNDLPIGIFGFILQRSKYGKYKELTIIFNTANQEYEYNLNTNKSQWKVLLSDSHKKGEIIKDKKIIIKEKSTLILGIKDDNYKK